MPAAGHRSPARGCSRSPREVPLAPLQGPAAGPVQGLTASLRAVRRTGSFPQWPELPGLECHSLRGGDDVPRRVASRRATVMASSPAGLMSA